MFQSNVDYPTDSRPLSIAITDIDGDGKPDVIIACAGGDTVDVLLGKNDSTQPRLHYPVGRGPGGLAIADIAGDGKPDVIVVNTLANSVSVLVSTCLP